MYIYIYIIYIYIHTHTHIYIYIHHMPGLCLGFAWNRNHDRIYIYILCIELVYRWDQVPGGKASLTWEIALIQPTQNDVFIVDFMGKP